MIAALVAAIALASPSSSPAAAASPAPQEIFDRAFAKLASYPVAPYALELIKETDHAAGMVPGVTGGEQYYPGRYAFRTGDHSENAAPFVPNAKTLPDANVYHGQPRGPFLWQIRGSNFRAPDEPGDLPLPDVPQPLKTIGHVVAYAPAKYAIVNEGIVSVNGRDAYHLALTPMSNPSLHNLREIWIRHRRQR